MKIKKNFNIKSLLEITFFSLETKCINYTFNKMPSKHIYLNSVNIMDYFNFKFNNYLILLIIILLLMANNPMSLEPLAAFIKLLPIPKKLTHLKLTLKLQFHAKKESSLFKEAKSSEMKLELSLTLVIILIISILQLFLHLIIILITLISIKAATLVLIAALWLRKNEIYSLFFF
jgi:hypothetical protein